MSSLFLESKQSTYRNVRAISQGASISLLAGCGEFVATFNCAVAVASVLGDRALCLEDTVPHYRIPVEEMYSALVKLSARYSIALLEVTCGDEGARFILLWKIPVLVSLERLEINLDDY